MIGIFITARLGSTRLARKHLIKVQGRSFIEWLIKRFLVEFNTEIENKSIQVFITTSTELENEEFGNIFNNTLTRVFYGSDKNIPLRHLQCAIANDIDYIISVDGDDILCSPTAARLVLDKIKMNGTMASTSGLPLGMNVMGYSTLFLKGSIEKNNYSVLETGWGKIFNKDEIEIIPLSGYENAKNLRMTLDYSQDELFFKKVIEKIGNDIVQITDKDLLERIINDDLSKLNEDLNDEYWINFNQQKKLES